MKTLLLFVLLVSFFYGNQTTNEQINQEDNTQQNQNNFKQLTTEKKGSLSFEEVTFLASLAPQVAPEIIPYSFIPIKPRKSYPARIYDKDNKEIIYQQNQNRITQAKLYQENGNIDEFKEILLDLLTNFNYSLIAPEVAMLLADFEYSILNLDSALLYYLYVANNHFYSPWGEEAYFKVGLTLAKRKNFLEATKIMKKILADSKNTTLKKQAKEFLEDRYLLLAQVAYQKKKYEEAKKHLDAYNALK